MRALVTGASGQAGSYLCEHLLSLGYEVYAMVRRNTQFVPERSFLANCLPSKAFRLVRGDVTDPYSLERLCEEIHPQHFYNAAAQSHVHESWDYPIHTVDATAKGVLHCLEVIRKTVPSCKFVQFSSSELFGMARETPQNEDTPFYPRSPYGVSKLFGHWMTVNYRESYDLFACCAILFNMESPRRGPNFVTQKIAQGVSRISDAILRDKAIVPLRLGNLEAKRDWNDARLSMQAVVKMLERSEPRDYVIGSGESHTVREFLERALCAVELDGWERHYDEYFSSAGDLLVTTDKAFLRPAEVPLLVADSTRARNELGYDPSKQNFIDLVAEMVGNA